MRNKALLTIVNVINDAESWYNRHFVKLKQSSTGLMDSVFKGIRVNELNYSIQSIVRTSFGKNFSYTYDTSREAKTSLTNGLFIGARDIQPRGDCKSNMSLLSRPSGIVVVDIESRASRFMSAIASDLLKNNLLSWLMAFTSKESYELFHSAETTGRAYSGNYTGAGRSKISDIYSLAYSVATKYYPTGYAGGLIEMAPRLTDDTSIEIYRLFDELISIITKFDETYEPPEKSIVNGFLSYAEVGLESTYDAAYLDNENDRMYARKLDECIAGPKPKRRELSFDSFTDSRDELEVVEQGAWLEYTRSIDLGFVKRLEDYFIAWQMFDKLSGDTSYVPKRSMGVYIPNNWIMTIPSQVEYKGKELLTEFVNTLRSTDITSISSVFTLLNNKFGIRVLVKHSKQLHELFNQISSDSFIYNKSEPLERLTAGYKGAPDPSTTRAYIDDNSIDLEYVTDAFVKDACNKGHMYISSLPAAVQCIVRLYDALSKTHDIKFVGNNNARVITLPFIVGTTTDIDEFIRLCGFVATPKKKKDIVNDETKPKPVSGGRRKGK